MSTILVSCSLYVTIIVVLLDSLVPVWFNVINDKLLGVRGEPNSREEMIHIQIFVQGIVVL